MFLIELSVDGLAYLKGALKRLPVQGDDVTLHADITKALDRPIIGEKLVQDIQQKALQGSTSAAPMPPAPPMPTAPPQDAIPAYPMPPAPPMPQQP